jgi:methylated-DNA-[protein]-cysteine S-methyltransferase
MPAKKFMPSVAPAEMLAFPFSTLFGPMAIAWAGEKIVATQLPEKNKAALLESLRSRLRTPALEWSASAPSFVRKMADQITRHLRGEAQEFSLDHVALENISPFFRKVYEVANRIPSGKVLTYGEVARAAGSPKASRAVGQAMAKNPFLLLVPCHRVVGGSHKLVGFSANGGVKTKASLLELESLAHARSSHHES